MATWRWCWRMPGGCSATRAPDVAQIIAFPQHRVVRVFTDTLPAGASPYEEAIFHVRHCRATRDATNPAERKHHVAAIGLEWWQGELARIVAARHPEQAMH